MRMLKLVLVLAAVCCAVATSQAAEAEAQRHHAALHRRHDREEGMSAPRFGSRDPNVRAPANGGRFGFGGVGAGKMKGEFAHLVGTHAEDAAQEIRAQRPDLNVQVVPEGSMVTMDVRPDRVRIFKNKDGTVSRPPRIG